MKKKVLSVLMAVSLTAAVLAGCSSGGDASSTGSASSAASTGSASAEGGSSEYTMIAGRQTVQLLLMYLATHSLATKETL